MTTRFYSFGSIGNILPPHVFANDEVPGNMQYSRQCKVIGNSKEAGVSKASF